MRTEGIPKDHVVLLARHVEERPGILVEDRESWVVSERKKSSGQRRHLRIDFHYIHMDFGVMSQGKFGKGIPTASKHQ